MTGIPGTPSRKGKPVARRGRKATGQASCLTAGLPKEGDLKLSGNMEAFRKKEDIYGISS
jgi:hypothetical protein